MVLDAKALSWAARNDIDTAKLKKAKVPIYGKWYFPEIPPGVPLVNLETGEVHTFGERMFAGELIWAPEAELREAGLLPQDFVSPTPVEEEETALEMYELPPEPLLAMARPPGWPQPVIGGLVPVAEQIPLVEERAEDLARVHMPLGSIAPLVLAFGFCLAVLGLITSPIIIVVGLVWMLVGAIGWIRIGMLELASAPHGEGEHHS